MSTNEILKLVEWYASRRVDHFRLATLETSHDLRVAMDAIRDAIEAARSTPKQGEAVASVSRSNDTEGLVQWATTRVPVGTMLYASPPPQQVEPGWQPIETAAKDGSEVIGWRADFGQVLIRYTSCDAFMSTEEIERSGMDEETIFQKDWFCADFIQGCRLEGSELPTHWHELPLEPESTMETKP